jgi:glycosyltransferase involved in cell wall biosynthesis
VTRTCLLHISGNQYPPLPADHHTRRIWEELAKGFDEYHVLARAKGMRFSHSVQGNIHLHLLPSFGRRMWVFFFLSWLLPYFVVRYRPTHMLAQCPVLGGLAAAACAILFRVPLIVELHGAHYFAPARTGLAGVLEFRIYKWLSWIAFAAADRIRSLSQDMTDSLCDVYWEGLRGKVCTIPTRVDLSVFAKAKADYTTGDVLRVITVGSFFPRKNHINLIRDLRLIGIRFRLVIVGSGPLRDDYLRLSVELGIAESIVIAGQVGHHELARLLVDSDVCIHYALSEGLPRAILEAMAAGLPVVTTRVGFIQGVLEDGENALVLDPPWGAGLAQALTRIGTSERLRRKIGENGRRTIEDRFESNLVFEQYRRAIFGAGSESTQSP